MFQEYLLQNWPLILVLLAFIISLLTTIFLDKKMILRMYLLIFAIFLLSIAVFFEFHIIDKPELKTLRVVLVAVRYSSTPLIIALIGMTLVKRMRWFVFIPAIVILILNIVSIFTGIVFSINESNNLVHGPLWILPYVVIGLYSFFLIYLLIRHSNKRLMEIIPISFLAFSLGSGLVLPFIFKEAYAPLFCATIAIALFAYYVFSILQLTKKDSLTGLLNRHAYFADINKDPRSITALISIDMNGLKKINDNEGHVAGDEALVTLALCFIRALGNKQSGYRIGGDEFIIVCRKTAKEETLMVIDKIKKSVAETKYTVSIGYGLNPDGDKTIDDLIRESDEMMYLEKENYYKQVGDRRRHN